MNQNENYSNDSIVHVLRSSHFIGSLLVDAGGRYKMMWLDYVLDIIIAVGVIWLMVVRMKEDKLMDDYIAKWNKEAK